ncbi:EAL domain-containing protein [Chitinimonas koreensis]|uniref:EAL domain-containing protein n=1 Tax=Chitinimonas koreensis TaxID=356302 RepID=UPI00042635EA|nr:EAL domain-containing protein [Chitinimonas koreensis]QNM94806.1 EAL domain-containing protein [Chitinimonas koreensis]
MERSLIKILLLEDVLVDVELACDVLVRAGLALEVRHVSDEPGYRAALAEFEPDIILADYTLPQFDGFSALLIRREMAPETPFVFLTGSLGEERAVETLRTGATDYVLKQSLPRLPAVVLRALAEHDALRDQVRTQRELEHERQLLRAVLGTTGALIVVLDQAGRITRLNPAAESAIGLSQDKAAGRDCWSLFAAAEEMDGLRSQFARLGEAGDDPVPWRTTLGGRRRVLWSAGRLPRLGSASEYAVLAGIDVTEQEVAEQQAHFLRHYDHVTGLPNRELLRHRLAQATAEDAAVVADERHALVLIGVERLPEVRDSLGVATGNQLLREVSRRLLGWQQAGDWLSRVGDASFALVLEGADERELPSQLQRLLDQLRQPYRLDEREFFLPAYLGVALHEPGMDPDFSLQAAEAALHRAVLDQSSGAQFYQPILSDEAHQRLLLEAELHEALQDEGQLELHYQPQASLANGRIVAIEALVRWRHPRLGLIPPLQFIPMAEACGLIIALGERVLLAACRQAAAWQRAGLPHITVAVNLAAAQWAQPDLIDSVRRALDLSGLDPQWLELELTESTSMHAPAATIAVMEQLRAMGVHLSIDDFGTGYCNLSYLKRFPVDKLKIDRSFVSDITTDPDDLAISRTVVAIAHQLGLEVVAEGVETEGQLALLADAGCDLIQGFFFSRPLVPEACASLLADRTTLASWRRNKVPNTLLLLDDEPNVLAALKRVLRNGDYRILATTSPTEAFELLATHEVGVIVADQRMAELSGTEFLNRVKDMYPATIRMILSGYTDLQTVTEAINRGAIYKFLTKPWDDGELTATVAEAFVRYAAERERHG